MLVYMFWHMCIMALVCRSEENFWVSVLSTVFVTGSLGHCISHTGWPKNLQRFRFLSSLPPESPMWPLRLQTLLCVWLLSGFWGSKLRSSTFKPLSDAPPHAPIPPPAQLPALDLESGLSFHCYQIEQKEEQNATPFPELLNPTCLLYRLELGGGVIVNI